MKKRPKEGVRARTLFCQSFGENDQKNWANGEGGSEEPPYPPLGYAPACARYQINFKMTVDF